MVKMVLQRDSERERTGEGGADAGQRQCVAGRGDATFFLMPGPPNLQRRRKAQSLRGLRKEARCAAVL